MDSPTAGRSVVEVAIAIIFNERGELLICKRTAEAELGGYWEFPGGKCLAGEAPHDSAVREVLEETALTVRVLRSLDTIEHHYPHAHVRLHPFLCRLTGGTLQLAGATEAKWIVPQAIHNYRFPEANGPVLKRIAAGLDALTEFPSPH